MRATSGLGVFLWLVACGSSEDPPFPSSEAGSGGGVGAAAETGGSAPAGGAGGTPSAGPGGSSGDGGGGGEPSTALPKGSVSGETATPCPGPPATPAGATCTAFTVSCPGIDDLAGAIAVTEPTGTPVGTVIVNGGGGGIGYFNGGFATDFAAAGLRVVQLRWSDDWERSSLGIKAAACRPATAFQWVYDNAHEQSASDGFCLQGFSGGSGAISYALAHYGLDQTVDYAQLISGPPFGRLDYGCDPALYSGGAIELCPEIGDAPYGYADGPASTIDDWEGTASCGDEAPSAVDVARWTEDSVVSPGADFDYGAAVLEAWFCANSPNAVAGQGALYLQQITSPLTITCVAGQIGASACAGETVHGDPGAYALMVDALVDGCVAR